MRDGKADKRSAGGPKVHSSHLAQQDLVNCLWGACTSLEAVHLHSMAGAPPQRLWALWLVTGVSGEKLVKPEPKPPPQGKVGTAPMAHDYQPISQRNSRRALGSWPT